MSVASRDAARRLRVTMVWVIVVSFGIAAISGITVLLGGDLGDNGFRVLGTTALVGAFSVAVLCCLALVGRRLQWFGFAGAAAAVLTLIDTLVLVWSDGGRWSTEAFNWMGTGVAVTIGCAFASLLLLLADRRRVQVRIGLCATLVLFAVVLVMVCALIWFSDDLDREVFPRVLGVAGILAALGAIVVPVMSLLLPERSAAAAASVDAVPSDLVPSGAVPAETVIAPELARRLHAEAARRGITVESLVAPLLHGGAAPVGNPPSPAP